MKRVILELEGLDGNAFSILGAFRSAARRQGWAREEIDSAVAEAMSGDYNHLLMTMIKYTDSPDE